MNVNEVLTYYSKVWKYIQQHNDLDYSVSECSNLRGYTGNKKMQVELAKQGIAYINSRTFDREYFSNLPKELGLVSKNDNFLLSDRFVLPIKDIQGNVLSLVGWYPDDRKYITANSILFSKKTLFYGLENLQVRQNMCITEGIFDRLALEANGIPAMATMGADVSDLKTPLYYLVNRLVGFPDMDEAGIKVRKYDKWKFNTKGRYVKWNRFIDVGDGGDEVDIKDIDTLCQVLPTESILEMVVIALQPNINQVLNIRL